jgi:hypothetical protein
MNQENILRFILSELHRKICTCPKENTEAKEKLNPTFHTDGCLYKAAANKEGIEWTKEETSKSEEPTQES